MSAVGLHKILERNTGLLIFGILVVSSIGGLVQVLPTLFEDSLATAAPNVKPYTPLELIGRDIYIREYCSVCHSQQVRPLLAEVKRYGRTRRRASSSTTGRSCGARSARARTFTASAASTPTPGIACTSPIRAPSCPSRSCPAIRGSPIAPADADGDIERSCETLRMLGHPYDEETIEHAGDALEGKSELDALIAYLQVLGTAGPEGTEMTYFIFIGDMFVMAFMIGVVVWVSLRSSKQALQDAALIPLEDEAQNG